MEVPEIDNTFRNLRKLLVVNKSEHMEFYPLKELILSW